MYYNNDTSVYSPMSTTEYSVECCCQCVSTDSAVSITAITGAILIVSLRMNKELHKITLMILFAIILADILGPIFGVGCYKFTENVLYCVNILM